jgi:hypothetical protein
MGPYRPFSPVVESLNRRERRWEANVATDIVAGGAGAEHEPPSRQG